MSVTGSISEMGYIALATRDLPASIKHAEDILGLTVTQTTSDKAYLAARSTHHEVIYVKSEVDGVDHFGVVASNAEELLAIRDKVDFAHYQIVSETPLEDFYDLGFAFVGPEGYTWHVYVGHAALDIRRGNFGPDRYGHINIKTPNSVVMRDFLINIFNFRVSDQIGEDAAFFLRCNTDHHGVAIMKAPHVKMHHYAFQAQSIADLGKLGDRLARSGSRLNWGPVRHGAGHNIAAYYIEPAGSVVELYTDLECIFDFERKANVWAEEDLYWMNQWDGHVPPQELFEAGAAPISR